MLWPPEGLFLARSDESASEYFLYRGFRYQNASANFEIGDFPLEDFHPNPSLGHPQLGCRFFHSEEVHAQTAFMMSYQ